LAAFLAGRRQNHPVPCPDRERDRDYQADVGVLALLIFPARDWESSGSENLTPRPY
jgi:hypothetical protein